MEEEWIQARKTHKKNSNLKRQDEKTSKFCGLAGLRWVKEFSSAFFFSFFNLPPPKHAKNCS